MLQSVNFGSRFLISSFRLWFEVFDYPRLSIFDIIFLIARRFPCNIFGGTTEDTVKSGHNSFLLQRKVSKRSSTMASRKGGSKNFPSLNPESGFGKGGQNIDQLNQKMTDASLEDEEGKWEVYAKKTRNKSSSGATGKQWESSNSAPKSWGHPEGIQRQAWGTNYGAGRGSGSNLGQANDFRRPAGRGYPSQQTLTKPSHYMGPSPAIPHQPLQHGWQWGARGGPSTEPKIEEPVSSNLSQEFSGNEYDSDPNDVSVQPDVDSNDDDDELVEDSDEDDDDDYDSDASEKSHETKKKNKWFKGFFEALDKLTIDEINEQSRQWHCPACHKGPGAIDWYKGLQSLVTHAKTKGSTRAKLHREFASLVEEELRLRGTSVVPAGEAFGKWTGLKETITDHEIVWPPVVVVMNTILTKDENDKWIGMGNQELIEYFSTYAAAKARHSYGPQGHRGMSVLIFESTAMGYMEAERLNRHFEEEGMDKAAWERRNRPLFTAGGKRQLYGYLARKEDMEEFNRHCQGKSRLKFEMRSYREMVVIPMKKMSEDNQKLTYLKNKVSKQEQRSKALEETFEVVTQKLRETMEENRIVRSRTKIQHEENKEEMDYQERFFKEQMDKIRQATEEKEKFFERLLQEERAEARQLDVDFGTNEDGMLRKEKIAKFINSQEKVVEEFESERDKIIRLHEEKVVALRQKYLAEEVELEKEFDDELTKLMGKFAPTSFQSLGALP